MNDNTNSDALRKLIARLRLHYGERLVGIQQIGPDTIWNSEDRADAEIVVILADGDWRQLDEHRKLAGLTFDSILEDEVYVRAWPVAKAAWENAPTSSETPGLVAKLRRNATAVLEVV